MPYDAFLAVLVVGALMIVADGQLLYRSGKRYLATGDAAGAESGAQARLVVVLFHLLMFGALALLTVLDLGFGGGVVRAVVGNLGVLLLLLAGAHGVTMSALGALGEAEPVSETPSRSARGRGSERRPDPVVAPVPGQRGRDPHMSPSIEEHSA